MFFSEPIIKQRGAAEAGMHQEAVGNVSAADTHLARKGHAASIVLRFKSLVVGYVWQLRMQFQLLAVKIDLNDFPLEQPPAKFSVCADSRKSIFCDGNI